MISHPHHLTRRSFVQDVLPLLLFPTTLQRTFGRQRDGEHLQSQDQRLPKHAVIVATDLSVPQYAALQQSEAFIEDGLHAVEMRVTSCADIDEFDLLARSCNTLIGQLRRNARIQTITVLAWCDALSPIKWLLGATNADAVPLRLFTSSIKSHRQRV